MCPSTHQRLGNKGFGSREVTLWLWWKGIYEWKKLLSSTDLKINSTPSSTIPACNRNTRRVSPLLMKEANAYPVSICGSINIQNIQKHLQSNSEWELAGRKCSCAAQSCRCCPVTTVTPGRTAGAPCAPLGMHLHPVAVQTLAHPAPAWPDLHSEGSQTHMCPSSTSAPQKGPDPYCKSTFRGRFGNAALSPCKSYKPASPLHKANPSLRLLV